MKKRLKMHPISATALAAADIEALSTLEFNVFQYDMHSDALLEMIETIFDKHKVLTTFKIPKDKFRNWLQCVRYNYHAEALFHNFRHAFNVLQTLHVFLDTFEAAKLFSELELFAMLFAALCHDLQHPGVNNKFLADTMHDLAFRYNNQSILEHHHCATAFAILNSASTRDITSTLKGDPQQPSERFAAGADFRQFRDLAISMILSTDVSTHKSHTEKLKAMIDGGFKHDDPDHRRQLMCSLVEAADISNEARGFEFSNRWAPLVQKEFLAQGDRQLELGIPVAAMNDRNKSVLGKEQQGFIKFLCEPLYEQLIRVVPKMEVCLTNLRSNHDSWGATTPKDPTQQDA